MCKFILVIALCLVASAANANDVEVVQSHMTFNVDSLTLESGDTVIFNNKDEVSHNIQVLDADDNLDDKGLQKPGQSIKETFISPGKYKVMCAIHPKMKMTVIVQ